MGYVIQSIVNSSFSKAAGAFTQTGTETTDNRRNERGRELDMVASDYRGGFETLSAFPTNRHNPIGWRGFNTDGGDQSAKD